GVRRSGFDDRLRELEVVIGANKYLGVMGAAGDDLEIILADQRQSVRLCKEPCPCLEIANHHVRIELRFDLKEVFDVSRKSLNSAFEVLYASHQAVDLVVFDHHVEPPNLREIPKLLVQVLHRPT